MKPEAKQDLPKIEVMPLRAAVKSDAATELPVLVRITPPRVRATGERPALNIGIVIDRSGSMQGEKLRAAKNAAIFAVRGLEDTDRVAVTIFDDEIETVVPSTLAHDRERIVRQIQQVQCNGTTALHAGWLEGGMQVSAHQKKGQLERVLLLTDGQANVGETNNDRICSDVRGLAQRGVTTSTLGVGVDYNEDLLTAMATSGDGNYYFIEGATKLEAIFAAELQGLKATTGRTVSLGLEPQRGVRMVEVLNDLELTDTGRLKLPNLIAGNSIDIVMLLHVEPSDRESDICLFRLAFDTAENGRQVMRAALSLPAVSSREWDALPTNVLVEEQVAHKQGARLRQRAVEALDAGDMEQAQRALNSEMDFMVCAPASVADESRAEIEELRSQIARGEHAAATKSAKFATYRKRRSRGDL